MAKFLDEAGLEELWALVKAEDAKGAKIVHGTYTGKGTYGSSNKNSLTFGFTPIIVFLYPSYDTANVSHADSQYNTDPFPILFGVTKKFYENATSYYHNNVSYSGNTMSWYCEGGSGASTQYNTSGKTYHYVAIG